MPLPPQGADARSIKELSDECALVLREAISLASSAASSIQQSSSGSSSSGHVYRQQNSSSHRFHPYQGSPSRQSSSSSRYRSGLSGGRNDRSSSKGDTLPVVYTAYVPHNELEVRWEISIIAALPIASSRMDCVRHAKRTENGWLYMVRNYGEHKDELVGGASKEMLQLIRRGDSGYNVDIQDIHE
jgi:hypothetical protein